MTRTLPARFAQALLIALSSLGSASVVMAAPVLQDLEPVFLSSLPPVGPAELAAQDLDLVVLASGFDPIEFSTSTVAVPGFPGWRGVVGSPLGTLVFAPVTASPGQFLLAFLDFGVTVPLSWNGTDATFSGTNGSVTVVVAHTPVFSSGSVDTTPGPGNPPVIVSAVPRPDGNSGIRIEVAHSPECWITFYQFVSNKVTWSGGPGVGGTCPFPVKGTGNNGNSTAPDGSRVYSDSKNPSGDYDSVTATAGGVTTTSMEDGPELTDPDPTDTKDAAETLKDLIEADPSFPPTANVTSITVEFHMTVYVYRTCIPMPSEMIARIEWSYKRTYDLPKPAGGYAPGGLGGPNAPDGGCGFPLGSPEVNVNPSGTMSADHDAALTAYLAGDPKGSPTVPW